MSTLTKVFVVLVFLFAVATLGMIALLFSQRVDWKDRFIKEVNYHHETVIRKNHELVAKDLKVKDLEEGLRVQRHEIDLLNEDLKGRDREIANLKLEVEAYKEKYDNLVAQISRFQNEIISLIQYQQELRKQIDDLRQRAEKAEAEAAHYKQQYHEISFKLDIAEKMLADTEKKAYELALEQQKLRDKITAIAERHPTLNLDVLPPFRPVEGLISAVKAEAGLVVINVGQELKVNLGDEFVITREDKYIATIVVEKTEKNYSVARIRVHREDPRVGDRVKNTLLTRPDIVDRKEK